MIRDAVPLRRSSVLRSLRDVPVCVAATVAIEVFLLRRVFAPPGPAFVAALTIVVLAWNLLLALVLADRHEGRSRGLALLVLPATLAFLPGTTAHAWTAVPVLGVAAGLVAAGALVIRRPVVPAACAAAGTALGWAVCASRSGVAPARIGWGLGAAALLAAGLWLARSIPRPASAVASVAAPLLLCGAAALLTERPWRPVLPALGPAPAGRPPAVLVVLDSVRADHLRSYGYARDTMPALERFARRHAQRFDRSLSSAASSLASHGSMFTGLRPSRHGGHECDAVLHPEGRDLAPLRDDVPTLAQLLRHAGYWTVGLSGNYVHLAPHLGAGRGFETYRAAPGRQARVAACNPFRNGPPDAAAAWLGRWAPFSDSQFFERPAPVPYPRAGEIVDASLAVLGAAGSHPFFLFVNLFDAHQPYQPPVRYRELFGAGPRLRSSSVESAVAGRASTPAEVQALVDSYDEELRYVDAELGRLLAALESHPSFEETLVVIVGDHGEAFGEHGTFSHGSGLYDENIRVPLFIKPGSRRSGLEPGGATSAPFQSVDVFPSVLEHAGLPVPAGVDGVAFGVGRTASTSEAFVCSAVIRDRARREEAARRPERFMRRLGMIEVPPWKLIVSSTRPPKLFDLATDPHETRNEADRQPEVLARLIRALPPVGSDVPGSPSPLPADLVEALQALGYVR